MRTADVFVVSERGALIGFCFFSSRFPITMDDIDAFWCCPLLAGALIAVVGFTFVFKMGIRLSWLCAIADG